MKYAIYHGSNHVIERPEYGIGKPYNDYGLGFYCTQELDLAKEWATSGSQNGFANCYSINTKGMRVLNLNSEEYCILHWLSVLLENRTFDATGVLARDAKDYLLANFLPEYKTADVIIGYRADDSYFSFAQDFINGAISYQTLGRAMHLGKLGEQFVLKSPAAFQAIKFQGAVEVPSEIWFEKRMNRDRAARDEYFNAERNKRQKGDLYITQILDEEMKSNDARLR